MMPRANRYHLRGYVWPILRRYDRSSPPRVAWRLHGDLRGRRIRRRGLVSRLFGLLLFTGVLQTRPVRAQTCTGDCDGNLRVTVDELILGTTIALGSRPLSECLPYDSSGDRVLSIAELTAAVAASLGSCPGAILAEGICQRPGDQGLIGCSEGTTVRGVRCDVRSTCLPGPTGRVVLEFGRIQSVGGQFSLLLRREDVAEQTLVFEADVEPQTNTVYRTMDFGPIIAGGRTLFPIPSGQGAGLQDVVIGPAQEAAVRLLDEAGLENCSNEGVLLVLEAVELANVSETFAGLSAPAAVDVALGNARQDPAVGELLRTGCAGETTPTATASGTPTATPSATPSATITPSRTDTTSSTPTQTRTPTSTGTATQTSTATPTRTSTATNTPTLTATNTRTPTNPPAPTPTTACGNTEVIPGEGGVFEGVTSGSDTLAGCGESNGPERVFQWTPNLTGFWSIRTCGGATNFDTIVYLLSASCPSGEQVACNDDSIDCTISGSGAVASRIAPFVSAGLTYFIVVDGFSGQSGPFNLTVSPATACDFATTISGDGGVFGGTTSDASPLETGCNGSGPAQVFRFVPNASGVFEMNTCGNGTNFDTVVSVRQGDCDAGAELACNDDACVNVFSQPEASVVQQSLAAGQSYYIVVNGFNGDSGDFSLTVGPPVGD